MYYTIVFFIIILLLPPTVFSSSQVCDKSQLKIIARSNKPENAKEFYRFKIGETLEIEVGGECMVQVKKALDTASESNALQLYLDDVKMEGISIIAASQNEIEKKMTLAVHLARDSNDEKNRKAWDMLLSKQHDGYDMTLPVGISVSGNIPWEVPAPGEKGFQLYIVTKTNALLTLSICLILFLTAYYLLVNYSTALRDRGSGSYSLGKSQMAFWGLLVILAFASIWYLTGTMERIPMQALILIGISGTTGLSSVVIGKNKEAASESKRQAVLAKFQSEQQQFQQSGRSAPRELTSKIKELSKPRTVSKSKQFWRGICDDGNGMSFHRLQVVLWTVLLGAVFIRSIAQTISMPEFSETLLLLLGISNGLYLGFKLPE